MVPDIALRSKIKRLVAIVFALADMTSSIPGIDPVIEHVQTLASVAEEWADDIEHTVDSLPQI